VPELRRYTLSALIPAPLQQPIAILLDRLPSSVCALPLASIADLPLTFKYQACPVSDVLQQLQGKSTPVHTSWAYSLAEVAMGAANTEPSNTTGGAQHAKVDAWLMRMCSAIYAPDVACNSSAKDATVPPKDTLEIVEQRLKEAKPVSVELVIRSLQSMPQSQRKRLVDGVAKQLDLWSQRATVMPRSVTSMLFGPFCSIVDDKQSLLMTTAVDMIKPLPILEAIVGVDRADAAISKVCGLLQPPPKQVKVASSNSSIWGGKVGSWMSGAAASMKSLMPSGLRGASPALGL